MRSSDWIAWVKWIHQGIFSKLCTWNQLVGKWHDETQNKYFMTDRCNTVTKFIFVFLGQIFECHECCCWSVSITVFMFSFTRGNEITITWPCNFLLKLNSFSLLFIALEEQRQLKRSYEQEHESVPPAQKACKGQNESKNSSNDGSELAAKKTRRCTKCKITCKGAQTWVLWSHWHRRFSQQCSWKLKQINNGAQDCARCSRKSGLTNNQTIEFCSIV